MTINTQFGTLKPAPKYYYIQISLLYLLYLFSYREERKKIIFFSSLQSTTSKKKYFGTEIDYYAASEYSVIAPFISFVFVFPFPTPQKIQHIIAAVAATFICWSVWICCTWTKRCYSLQLSIGTDM